MKINFNRLDNDQNASKLKEQFWSTPKILLF